MSAEYNLTKEVTFRTARSGGSGGQNVNKVETMAELCWKPAESKVFTEEQMQIIVLKLGSRINADGCIKIRSQKDRSQLGNKQLALGKLEALIAAALIPEIKRKKTKVSRGAVEKRLKGKQIKSDIKLMRRKTTL